MNDWTIPVGGMLLRRAGGESSRLWLVVRKQHRIAEDGGPKAGPPCYRGCVAAGEPVDLSAFTQRDDFVHLAAGEPRDTLAEAQADAERLLRELLAEVTPCG